MPSFRKGLRHRVEQLRSSYLAPGHFGNALFTAQ
jgi:hypothetical protein